MRLLAALISSSLFCFSLPAQIQLQPAFPNLAFTNPLDLQAPPDGSNRVAVVTQPGVIYIFPNSSSVSSANIFLDIRDSVQYSGLTEEGLLGLGFHPDFAVNRHIFVNYTGKNPRRNIVARYTVSSVNADSVDKSTWIVITEIADPYDNHNAGQLAFGPDGYLYIGTGDGGSGGDPQNRAQDNTQLLGKMLRIDVNSASEGKNYSIPADNPYAGNSLGYREEIFAYGFRNPWRYSFDPVTNWLWVADVGQNAWEEIDIVEKGKNYGWRIMEGNHCYNPPTGCNSSGLTLPIWEYDHSSTGGSSITGGYVYRGPAIQELYGKYVYGDYGSGRVWFLSYDGTNPPVNSLFSNSSLSITSFGLDEQGELHLCAFDGKVYKFVKSSTSVHDETPVRSFSLKQNFPNPFNPSTMIEFSLTNPEHTTITIYNVVGQEVMRLVERELPAGLHRVRWWGVNQQGISVPSGSYLCRLAAGSRSETMRMILLR